MPFDIIFNAASYRFDPTNLLLWSGVINFAMTLAAFTYVAWQKKYDAKRESFLLFMVVIMVWAVCWALWHASLNAEAALFWARASMVPSIFSTTMFFWFVIELTEAPRGFFRYAHRIILMLLVAHAATVFTPYFETGIFRSPYAEFWPIPGFFFHTHLVLWSLSFTLAVILFYREYRKATGVRKKQYKLVLLAFIVGFLTAGTNFLPTYNINALPPYSILFTWVYVGILAYAVTKYDLFKVTPYKAADTILETMPDALFLTQPGGEINVANESAAELTGKKASVLESMRIQDILPESIDIIKEGKEAEDLNASIQTNKEGTAPVSVSSRHIHAGGQSGLVFICRDISERVERQKELDDQHEKLFNAREELKETNAKLNEKVAELETVNKHMTGREKKMMELKDEIERLKGDKK